MGVIIPFMTVGWAITAIITVDKEVNLPVSPSYGYRVYEYLYLVGCRYTSWVCWC